MHAETRAKKNKEESQTKNSCCSAYKALKARSKITVILRVLFLSLFPAPPRK